MHESPRDSALLLIGYGNPLRGDDGAGPAVVERMAAMQLPIRTLTCHLLTPELAELLAQTESVIFVDAAVNGPSEVQVQTVQPSVTARVSGHASTPAELLALTRDLYGCTPQAWSVTIPAFQFEFGSVFSAQTEHGISTAIEAIRHLL